MSNTEIFVFGSNLGERHGAGSALHARQHYNAKYGVGFGPTGNSYAIPTKDAKLKTLPLIEIRAYVETFIQYAKDHPELQFKIVAIGTGLAGYTDAEMGPLFKGAPSNCILPSNWEQYR